MKTMIRDLPAAQKRTGRSKKFVYVDKEFVYKGPYSPNDKSYQNLKKFSILLKILQKTLPTLNNNYKGDIDIEQEIEHKDGIFIKMVNVGNVPENDQSELVSTKIDTNYKVLPRNSYVTRVSDLEKSETGVSSDIAKALLQILYIQYVIGVGDVGSYNILVRKDAETSGKLLAAVDMEENRRFADVPPTCIMSALFNRFSKAQKGIYLEYVSCFGNDVAIFTEPFDAETRKLIKKVGGDPDAMEERVEHFLTLVAVELTE